MAMGSYVPHPSSCWKSKPSEQEELSSKEGCLINAGRLLDLMFDPE
jgi:hypothetical protein